MTVINHKNISGITSITTPAGSDNLFTVHTNDTTERFRIDASGHQNISGIITAANFKTGTSNVHSTGYECTNVNATGIVTAANISIEDDIIHKGDTNTKIRFPAADTITAETGGSERLRITSSGFLGIGSGSSTNKPLHIYRASDDAEIRLQTNSGTEQNSYIALRQATGDLDFYTVQSGTNMKFHTVNQERLRITSGGYVNIGGNYTQTTDKLQVDGTIRGNLLKAASSIYADANASTSLYLHSTGTTGDGRIFFGDASTFQAGKIVYNHNGDYMYFGTGGNGAERLRITSAGKVGIGSAIPSRHFVVVDDTGSGIGVVGTNAGIYMGTHHTGSFQVNAAIARAASTNYHITNSVAGDLCIASESTKNILFGTGPSAGSMHQRFKIKANGQSYFTGTLGVNVDVPSHNLHTHGTANTSGARFNINHTGTTVSGNTASGSFPHNVLLSNYDNSQPNNMATIGFDIPATTGAGAHANAVIVGQAENGNGNCSLQFWTESGNSIGERLRITSDGKFGFNTVTPYAYDTTATTLEVKGSVASASDTEVARFRGGSDADGGTAVLRLTNDNDRGLVVKGGRESSASEYAEFGVSAFNGSYTRALKINAGGISIFRVVPQIDNSTNQSSSENTFGHMVQRNWKKNIQPGKFQNFAEYYETEGNVALMIQVSSDTGGHSGTSTYYWQGGYLPSSGYGDSWHRLLPSYTGYGHGDNCDDGLTSNAWEVLIGGAGVTGNNYKVRVAVHVPSGRTTKDITITISEMRRGMTFTDLSSNSAGDWSTQTDSGTDAQNKIWSKQFITTNTPSDAGSNYNYRRNYLSGNQHLYWYNGNNQAYLHLNGTWTNASDIAYKKDVEEITYGIETVKQIKPRKYKHKGNDMNDVGFIAQELETVVPEVVSGDEGGKGISYGNLTAVLTKALQEAIVKIETLEAKVATLEGS